MEDHGPPTGQLHPDEIVPRVRDVLLLLYGEKAYAVEQEICAGLEIKDLNTYLQKPAGFFQDHLKRYTKSRRQAPIYWPLSTVSGSYTLWVYYHRLDDQTLYKCVMDYLDPKIEAVERRIAGKQAEMSESAKLVERQELEEEMKFLREIKEFKGEYDWAHIAYSIWPDRVKEKSRQDKSIAIAHGLEELYEEHPPQPKKRKG